LPLTPLDIHNVEFKKTLRGYSEDQVDSFLNKVTRDYENLYKENMELKERLEDMQAVVTHYRELENTLRDTMVLAQQVADEAKKNAASEAEILRREAQAEAARVLAEADLKVRENMRQYEELVQSTHAFRARMRGFLLAQLELWDDEPAAGQGQVV